MISLIVKGGGNWVPDSILPLAIINVFIIEYAQGLPRCQDISYNKH